MTLGDFVNQYSGQKIPDNHGNYPGECVSLVKRYAQEVLGVPNADSVLYVPDDKAKNMWYKFTPAMEQYFDKVTSPQPGDIAVYDVGLYGDVAVVTNSSQVFGQYGTPVFTPASERGIKEPSVPIGYLRLKGDSDMAAIGYETANQIHQDLVGQNWDKGAWQQATGGMLNFADTYSLVQNSQSRRDYQSYIAGLEKQASGVKYELVPYQVYKTKE